MSASPGMSSPSRLRKDKVAKYVVTCGGLGIIASILGILAFLILETIPLARGASVEDWSGREGREFLAALSGPYQKHFAAVDRGGVLVSGEEGKAAKELARLVKEGEALRAARRLNADRGFVVELASGKFVAQPFAWSETFVGSKRVLHPKPAEAATIDFGKPALLWASVAKGGDEGVSNITVFAQLDDFSVALGRADWSFNELAEEWEVETSIEKLGRAARLTTLALDEEGHRFATTGSILMWWPAEAPTPAPVVVPVDVGSKVTCAGLLLGQRSLMLGHADGRVSQWFAARAPGGQELAMRKAREFAALDDAIVQIAESRRNKAFVALGRGGGVALGYGTTGSIDWRGKSPLASTHSVAMAPKFDGLIVAGGGGFARARFDHPHPEASFSTFFTKTWYESFEEPVHKWASSSADDDFEPKLGMIPLLFGTLKGTIFAMLLSVPLAVLGAMFVSQFMHASFRAYIKPIIEIMAAMPSVILGFVAALWLAPLLEVGFTAFLLMPLVLPVLVVIAGSLWMRLPLATRERLPDGIEAFVFVGVLALGVGLCMLVEQPLENFLFGGSFPDWAGKTLGDPNKAYYEQKNSVVIAIAMSFAVIPIIFSISEDAFSNVPRNLVSGSLALGANRWQTVVRVVLPTASPGIFSATMVGFGRAIGETMIVLMATGNTAIMEWNPFNGFRTLSANIATEIPEAPVDGTLYRMLFLAALLLFVLTFAINSIAELIRQRLRRRYASL